jgi:uncharacterized protein (TIGR02996 family)
VTDQAALLRAILEAPADDAPRLVYADWLEENGEHERAEFIRVQAELAGHRGCNCQVRANGGVVKMCEKCTLRERERELWNSRQAPRWFFAGVVKKMGKPHCYLDLSEPPMLRLMSPNGDMVDCKHPNRGFVAEVRLPVAAFLGGPCGRCQGYGAYDHPEARMCLVECPACSGSGRTSGIAAALFAAQPVTRVTLTDLLPYHGLNNTFHWYDLAAQDPPDTHPPSNVPSDLYVLLEGYEDRFDGFDRRKEYVGIAAAHAALSRAAVALGRARAGLGGLR